MKEYISVVLSHKVCGELSQQPPETNTFWVTFTSHSANIHDFMWLVPSHTWGLRLSDTSSKWLPDVLTQSRLTSSWPRSQHFVKPKILSLGYMLIFRLTSSHSDINSRQSGTVASCSPLYPQRLTGSQEQSGHSMKVCWMTERSFTVSWRSTEFDWY